jgi:hypothetical protein
MSEKLFGNISLDFDVTGQLLIIFHLAYNPHLSNTRERMRREESIASATYEYRLQESLRFS